MNHQFLKLTGKYFFNDNRWLETLVAGQLNVRKEFDIRRGGRSSIPALNLRQYNVLVSGKYHHRFSSTLNLISGLQYTFIDNTNNPETGVFPLIPDYLSNELGSFVRITKQVEKHRWEVGARYDYLNQRVVRVNRDPDPIIERFNNNFHNLSATAGWTYLFRPNLRLTGNLGLATRNPAINELYSNGLHQGVSGIEEGDVNLKREESIKSTLSFSGSEHDHFSFEILGYYQRIKNYIYLDPQDSLRITLR